MFFGFQVDGLITWGAYKGDERGVGGGGGYNRNFTVPPNFFYETGLGPGLNIPECLEQPIEVIYCGLTSKFCIFLPTRKQDHGVMNVFVDIIGDRRRNKCTRRN